jgi:hypothetical protein
LISEAISERRPFTAVSWVDGRLVGWAVFNP